MDNLHYLPQLGHAWQTSGLEKVAYLQVIRDVFGHIRELHAIQQNRLGLSQGQQLDCVLHQLCHNTGHPVSAQLVVLLGEQLQHTLDYDRAIRHLHLQHRHLPAVSIAGWRTRIDRNYSFRQVWWRDCIHLL
jgi:hypothetical protein